MTAVNDAPVLGAIGNKSVNEQAALTFNATATDQDAPAQTLTFSLDAASLAAGMTITAGGAFAWTPTEAQGGAAYPVTITVTDNGTNPASLTDAETFTITVAEVNVAPVLGAIGNKSVNEQAALTFTPRPRTRTHPAQTLTFSLDAASLAAGMTITADGAFAWTPTEAQGGAAYPVTITVTDNGTNPANLTDSETFTITVAEVNVAPVLGAIGNKSVNEQAPLTFTATATDQDVPAQTLTFSLDAASLAAGMTITAGGAFAWTPTEAQGGAAYPVTITVTDNGTNPASLTDSETFTITVAEVNVAPVLGAIGNKSVNEQAALTFTATATDQDRPAQTLTFSLDAASLAAGMTITAGGAFAWTPTEAQGGAAYPVTITVTDNGTNPANLTDSETFTITVAEVNVAPVLGAIGNKSVNEQAPLTFNATATDQDDPAQTLTFSLDAASLAAGMTITAGGAFAWTPTEAQGGAAYPVTITVTDNGTNPASLTDSETFTITVAEVNVAPVLDAIGNKSVNEQAALTFNATATDQDDPAQTLTFSLDAASLAAGMTIDAGDGRVPLDADRSPGPGSYDVTITVTDNGTPALSDSETFAIVITGPTWQNPHHPCDVTGDGYIQPDDVLALVNDINAKSSRDLTTASPPTPAPPPFLDPDRRRRDFPRRCLDRDQLHQHVWVGTGSDGIRRGGRARPDARCLPRVRLPDIDAAEGTLPVDTVDGRPERTAVAGSTGQLACCQPGERSATVTAPRQERLPRRWPDGLFPKSCISPRSVRSPRLADGSAEFPPRRWTWRKRSPRSLPRSARRGVLRREERGPAAATRVAWLSRAVQNIQHGSGEPCYEIIAHAHMLSRKSLSHVWWQLLASSRPNTETGKPFRHLCLGNIRTLC